MKIIVRVVMGGFLGGFAWGDTSLDDHSAGTATQEIALGASYERVVDVLGEPSGLGRFDDRTLLSYERGTILMVDGRVTDVDLVDEATWEKRKAREEAEALARAKAAHAALQAMLTSAHFAEAPLETRVRRWSDFRRKWPTFQLPASYDEDLAAWRERVHSQRAQAAQDARIAGLERRVAEAERKAEEARAEAERNRSRTRRFSVGTATYAPPIIHGDSYYSYPLVLNRFSSGFRSAPTRKTTRSETIPSTTRSQGQIQHRTVYQPTVSQ